MGFTGLGFGVLGFGFTGSGFWVYGLRVLGLGFTGLGFKGPKSPTPNSDPYSYLGFSNPTCKPSSLAKLRFHARTLGFRGFGRNGFRVWLHGFGFRVWGLEFCTPKSQPNCNLQRQKRPSGWNCHGLAA